ncbi:hypothetical protein E2C01_015430 [Portunus trituberculatus]|uniref:Uncharacterized protein n=1 Tax=Portunus trituberculatus TaxID=210409 RepID=A0A5B7DN59_PORTR|nr:hypothetical protein [Portunus trituberculatus]
MPALLYVDCNKVLLWPSTSCLNWYVDSRLTQVSHRNSKLEVISCSVSHREAAWSWPPPGRVVGICRAAWHGVISSIPDSLGDFRNEDENHCCQQGEAWESVDEGHAKLPSEALLCSFLLQWAAPPSLIPHPSS